MPPSPVADAILNALDATSWDQADHVRARDAAALAITVYTGHTRDQGTPYLHHPLAVVSILRNELAVSAPNTLLLGLLHDALELSPTSAATVATHLGEDYLGQLQAMTPDHRLEQRPKQPGDEAAWYGKTARLAPDGLLVRLADRVHNLRDLRNSPNAGRRERFVAGLVAFYLPLADEARRMNAHLDAACTLLRAEYERYQQDTQEVRV
ncbi:HD domain-containing protein [Streptomyces sp. NPDC059373]